MATLNSKEKDSNKRDRDNEGQNEDDQEVNRENDSRSPIAKRGRNEVDRMESWKDSKEEQEVVKRTIVINNLVSKTTNDQVKKLIDCYNPLIHEETDILMRHILSCYETWEHKEETLKEAIRYVWPEIDIEIDEISNAEKLAEILLIALETLMPKNCKECNHYYIVKREDKPVIRCMWCRGGAHDCVDRGNKQKLKGMVWMCRVCNDTINKQIIPKISLVRKMELVKKEASINFEGFSMKPKKNNVTNKNKGDVKQDEVIMVEENDKTVNTDQRSNEDNNDNNNGNDVENVNNNTNERNNKSNKICWFYENRKCKFGEKCKDLHPESCKPMMEYGKCADSRCKLLHQKVCRNYYNQGYCTRYNCWFIHPSKIIQRNPARPTNYGQQQVNNIQRNMTNGTDQYNRNNESQNDYMNNNSNFLWNWPTPAEPKINMQQMLTKLMGTIEKVDSRIEKLEMRQANGWPY